MHKFKDEVAASRTFVFVREIEPLLSAGLIKGGDLDNAIVIYERKMSQESFDKLADVMGVEDGERLSRALNRERMQESPKYEELCRRFLSDAKDFSEERYEDLLRERTG